MYISITGKTFATLEEQAENIYKEVDDEIKQLGMNWDNVVNTTDAHHTGSMSSGECRSTVQDARNQSKVPTHIVASVLTCGAGASVGGPGGEMLQTCGNDDGACWQVDECDLNQNESDTHNRLRP